MTLRLLHCHLLGLSLFALVSLAHAVEVKFEPVVPGVYAFIGEKGGRTYANEELNANIGLVVTPRRAAGGWWTAARASQAHGRSMNR